MKHLRDNRGFTIVELLLIMGITSILIGLITMNLVKVQRNTSVSASVDSFIADLKGQQVKAMNGALATSNGYYGVYLQSNTNNYVLFHGSVYSASDSTNAPVAMDSSISITTTFLNNSVVFLPVSGEVTYTGTQNTITLSNKNGSENAKITFNKYGVVTNVQYAY